MTKPPINSNFSKSKSQVVLEYILLALCLCIVALRTTFTEGLSAQSADQSVNLGDTVYSLSVSAVLILSFVLWFVWSFCSKRFLWRFSAMEIGLFLFCIGTVIAGCAASNKRVAITDAICLLAPLLCAVLLVQILDSQTKIKLVLAVVAALGVVSAYQCTEQFFISNQVTIDQYEQAPWTMLEPLGIQQGSFKQFLFEHRLYTSGVRGFFTTGNSAGSFAILASFAAIVLFLEKFKNRKSDPAGPLHLVTCGIAVAAVLFGLAITKSKGAIATALIAALMFITYLLFGNWLKKHKKTILIFCLVFVIAGACGVASYGLTHGRLPGGNSMMVRWQYWYASAQMYADHPLTGIGPGNFTNFYPHYKPGAAIESVADPHNFLLSVLTQYGPLGLAGFLATIFLPLRRVISPRLDLVSTETHQAGPTFKKLAVVLIITISVALLLIRPVIMPVAAGEDLDVMIYVVFALFIAPVAAFVVGFFLLTAGGISGRAPNTNIIAALFCACIGVTLHNLIDFAIFEPGVLITFWVILAALIAMDSEYKHRGQFVFKPALFTKLIILALGLIITWAYLNYVLIPVAKSTAKIRQANQASLYGNFRQAHGLLDAAAQDDCLSPAALSLNGRLYLQRFLAGSKYADLLLYSEKCLLGAIDRNQNDFKNFERLANVYTLMAETSTPQEKTDWLNKAFDSANHAVQLYPGSGRLRVKLAEIAEQLDKNNIALEQYQKAIDIEDSFRVQFRLMYPDWEMFSRLGEEKYDFAKQRIKYLSEKTNP